MARLSVPPLAVAQSLLKFNESLIKEYAKNYVFVY